MSFETQTHAYQMGGSCLRFSTSSHRVHIKSFSQLILYGFFFFFCDWLFLGISLLLVVMSRVEGSSCRDTSEAYPWACKKTMPFLRFVNCSGRLVNLEQSPCILLYKYDLAMLGAHMSKDSRPNVLSFISFAMCVLWYYVKQMRKYVC